MDIVTTLLHGQRSKCADLTEQLLDITD